MSNESKRIKDAISYQRGWRDGEKHGFRAGVYIGIGAFMLLFAILWALLM